MASLLCWVVVFRRHLRIAKRTKKVASNKNETVPILVPMVTLRRM